MRAIHFICRRDLDGVSLNNLSYDKTTKTHRSGHWDISEADAKALVGGWLYLHPTKSMPSEFGGIVHGFERESLPSLAHSDRIVFFVERRPPGDRVKWRGHSHAMAFMSGVVEANYLHETSDEKS